jgi:hypothetical protein
MIGRRGSMMSTGAAAQSAGDPEAVSTWAPLHQTVFRYLWIASFASNVGTWMQTVGAQWLLIEQHAGPTLIALVQTASSLPVLLVTLPAGVVAEFFDRRMLLMGVQVFQTGQLRWWRARSGRLGRCVVAVVEYQH